MSTIIATPSGTTWVNEFPAPMSFVDGSWTGAAIQDAAGGSLTIGGVATDGLLAEATGSGNHVKTKAVGGIGAPETAGGLFFISCFAAKGAVNFLMLQVHVLNAGFASVGGYQYYNLNTGAVATGGAVGAGSVIEAGIEAVTNGYRCWAIVDCGGTDSNGMTATCGVREVDDTSNYGAADIVTSQIYAGGLTVVDGATGDLGYIA